MISVWLAIPLILTMFLAEVGVVAFALVCLAVVVVNLLAWGLDVGLRRAHRSHDAA